MITRTRVLIALLVAAGGFALKVGAGTVRDMTDTRARRAAELRDENDKLEADVAGLRKQAARLGEVKRRSLPADPDLARAEYAEAMRLLLKQANAPAGVTITPRTVDSQNVPTVGPKKPAYTRVRFDIGFKKAELATLIDFLKGFYRLNLSHQIVGFTVKRPDDSKRVESDRKDLDVAITAEAIILDGAETRRTLLSVPPALAAVGGLAGFQAVSLTPEAGRGLTAYARPGVLAAGREYAFMLAKDLFHGPLPPPPPPPKKEVVEAPPPRKEEPKPKPDIAPHIRLVGITLRSDGTAGADVWDAANNYSYAIDAGPAGTQVRKFVPGAKGARKADADYKPGGLLVISDEESGTARSYRLVAVDGDALYVSDSKATAVPVGPLAAAAGGPAALADRGSVYRWKVGQSLKDVKPVPADEVRAVLSRLAGADDLSAAR